MENTINATVNSRGYNILTLTKSVFWALSVSLLCILIFAFVIKFTALPESAIMPINQVIKFLSIFIGCWVASKKIKSNGWLWGIVIGAVYTLLAFIVFSILDGEFRFTLSLLNDFVFGAIAGLISGIIAFNLRK